MTHQTALQELQIQLKKLYDDREAGNIADWVMESVTGKKRIDRLLDKTAALTDAQEVQLTKITTELLHHTPVQYVLGEAWFCGMKFFVDANVLIPRPETEELVYWAGEVIKNKKINIKNILDIGTGSGCIPISLHKLMPDAKYTAIDVSKGALAVAERNAASTNTVIDFIQLDFLDETNWSRLPVFDIITSNPPYIKQSEESTMAKNVLDHEPLIALFVPDNDALIFYRKIAAFGKTHLNPGGSIFLEINEALGKETLNVFESTGYAVELKKDMQGKERMISANLKIEDLKI